MRYCISDFGDAYKKSKLKAPKNSFSSSKTVPRVQMSNRKNVPCTFLPFLRLLNLLINSELDIENF